MPMDLIDLANLGSVVAQREIERRKARPKFRISINQAATAQARATLSDIIRGRSSALDIITRDTQRTKVTSY